VRTRLILLAAFVAILVLGGVGATYAYDRSKEDVIAEGVKVNGVAIGGLTPAAAERKLRAALLDPLAKPVKVRYHGHHFTLTPRAAAVGIDLRGSVDQALARSREGNMFARAWRNLRGESLNTELAADVSWSKPAVDRLVRRVQRAVDKPAQDAAVDLSKGQVDPTPSHTGLRVRYNTLARDVQRTLLASQGAKTVKVHTKVVEPKVSSDQLADKYPSVIIVNRGGFKLTLYKRLKVAKTYGIAVGRVGLETPAGLYHIENKAVNPAWHVPNSAWAGDLAGQVIPPGDPGNPIKARWMGIYAGAGIHGTSEDGSIGTAASHGCIRMHIPDVEELYDQVDVGTPVYIA
jgi:lipoprotein-anchoring transpeptidase ErfK/SrfK